jgi:hypothetical protein
MRRFFPISLLGLVATGGVFLLQVSPVIGIFLMFTSAIFWSVVLINASMIGVAVEATVGRVSRLWLLLPMLFYGGYWIAATLDHLALREIASRYDESNKQIVTGFDPIRQVLVFENDGGEAWLTQNFALPVTYSVNPNVPDGYMSNRMIESSVCTIVDKTGALRAASIYSFDFHNVTPLGSRYMEKRFCNVSIPEKPKLPLVVVGRKETKDFERGLPVTRIVTTIVMPDGRRFELFGGVAAPLSWIPMPIMGCALNSAAPRWDCSAGFMRNRFTPIVSGNARYGRDLIVLAKALGLRPVAIGDRVGGDSKVVLARIAEIEKTTAKTDP